MDWINYVVLGLYIVMMIAIAYITRKKSKNLQDFLLAGKGLGGWMTAFAYGTTYFSAVIFIGYAGKFGLSFGLAAIWIGVGNALIGSLLAWKVLAKRTKIMTTNLKVKTMPEFFESRYADKNIKLFASLIIFVFLIPYSASVYQGLGYIFQAVFKIDFRWCIVVMAGLTALYLFFGGYYATALTDFIQGIIMLAGVAVMIIFIVIRPEVNLGDFAALGKGIIPAAGSEGIMKSNLFNVIIIVLLTSFGVWALPQTIHKYYAIKDNASIKRGMIVSMGFALIVGVGAYFVGSLVNFFPTAQGAVDTRVPEMLKIALPAGLMGLIVVLVLSASMSTLASLSLSGSSAVAVDIYKGYINKQAPEKKVNIILKISCLVFVLLSAIFAIFQIDAIVTLMGLSWGTLAGCFIGPYVYGLYNKKITAAAAWASMIGGLVVTLSLTLIFGAAFPIEGKGIISSGIGNSPLIGVITMGFSMIITPVVSYFTKPKNKENVDILFDSVKKDLVSEEKNI